MKTTQAIRSPEGLGLSWDSASTAATLFAEEGGLVPKASKSRLLATFAGVFGALGLVSAAFAADTTLPDVSITSPTEGATISGTFVVTGTASDNVAVDRVEMRIDAGPYQLATGTTSWSLSVDTTAYTNGPHLFKARATDTSGNQRWYDRNVTINNDTTPPAISISSPASGATLSNVVAVSGTASNNGTLDRVEVRLEDPYQYALATGTLNWTFQLNSSLYPNGPHTLVARATDTFGNQAWFNRSVSIYNPSTYSFRGIFDTARLSLGGNPSPFSTMNLSIITAYQGPSQADSSLVTVLDNYVPASAKGYIWMGGFAMSAGGGVMKIESSTFGGYAGKLEAVLNYTNGSHPVPAKNNPKSSHRYVVLDDMQGDFTAYNTAQRQANLNTIKAFCDRIKAVDPQAITAAVEYREAQIPMWVGVVDELWLDGYPNNNAANGGYLTNRIPDQAAAAIAAGIPFVGVISAHDNAGQPTYPTTNRFTQMMTQWKQTSMRGIMVYCWDDGSAPSLATDATLRAHIGTQMAAVIPTASHLWPFDGTFQDVAGANNGVNTGVTFTNAAKIGSQAGVFDGADFVDIGSISLGNAFSISMWVWVNSTATNIQTLIANSTAGNTQNGFKLFVNSYNTSDGKVAYETGNGSLTDSATSNAGAVTAGAWNKVTVTVNRTAGVAAIYVNNANVTSDSSIRTDFANSAILNLGQMIGNSWRFHGRLDDVRTYNKVLSASEVAEIP
jgi:hypothetical protein